MINGNSVICEFGKETTYGTAATPKQRVEFSSEGFKWIPNKKDEGLLTGGLTDGKVETMSIKTEGSISTIAKPETVGYFLKGTLGVEAAITQNETTKKYLHSFTAVGNEEADVLPSYTFVLDRKAGVFAYTGVKMNTLSFNAAAEDRLKIDVSMNGKEETTGTIDKKLLAEANKSFKFHQGKIYINDAEIADITSIKFEYNNNLDVSTQTTSTGKYFKEPTQGKREVKVDLEAVYSSSTESLRTQLYKTDDVFSMKVDFTDDSKNTLTITLPACQVSSMENATASGADTMKQSISAKAVDNSTNLVLIELQNDVATAY